MAATPPEQEERRRFSPTHVIEATTATVLAAMITGTAAGVAWLVIALPTQLSRLQDQITQIVKNQSEFSSRFTSVELKVDDHENRIIRLESR